MANKNARNANLPRPRRTLILFLVGIIALYGLVALIDVRSSGDDGSAWTPRLGLDLKGGTSITFTAEPEKGDKITAEKLNEARDIMDQRVNASGVAEAEVTTQGSNQVLVEIPDKKEGQLVDKVGQTAQLRFRLVWAAGLAGAATATDTAEAQQVVDDIDWSQLTLSQMIEAETLGVARLTADESNGEKYAEGLAALQTIAAGFACTPDGLAVEDIADQPIVTCNPDDGEVMILSPAIIEGTQIKTAEALAPQQQQVEWVVSLELRGAGTKTFDTVTEALFAQTNAGNSQASRFAVVLDGEVISAPTTNGHFTNGKSQISGNFTSTSARELANQLKYGALPLSFEVDRVSEIGPSLAGSQLDAGLIAGGIGLLLVVLYCLLYYRGLGLVIIGSLAVAAALAYVLVLLLGKGVGFTLTLPGIAGLIVAIGITADSFIVYFERIRDEVRDGKSLRLAVEAGWTRARGTILAADAVSILAAATLYIFAAGVVRGFAFALGLTTLIDIAVVFWFTKPLVSVLARTKFFGQGHKLSGLDAAHLGISGRKVSQIARTSGEGA